MAERQERKSFILQCLLNVGLLFYYKTTLKPSQVTKSANANYQIMLKCKAKYNEDTEKKNHPLKRKIRYWIGF
jgi:hypothetical protein